MARLLVLLPIILWLTMPGRERAFDAWATVLVLGGFVLIAAGYALLVRLTLRRRDGAWGASGTARRGMATARAISVVWFAFALYQLDFPATVQRLALPGTTLPTLIGTAPVYLCWFALHWSRFAVELAQWQTTLNERLTNGAPVHAPPGRWRYVMSRTRVEVLFALVPVAGVLALRDVASAGLARAGIDTALPVIEAAISFGGIALIFIAAPAILRHVLPTSSMPAGPLRQRLEDVANRTGMRFRDILVWHTDNAVANAAVMGLFPQVRYVLLSDLLIETMTDQQVEAVFAHEVGHVRHRHMIWYVVFVAIMMLALAGPGTDLERWVRAQWVGNADAVALAIVGATLGLFLTMLGLLSRQFEQQADVFASRNVTTDDDAPPVRGALVFATALRRVAQINGMPMTNPPLRPTPTGTLEWVLGHASSHFHGTVARRMNAVQEIAADDHRARRFDTRMRFVRALLLLLLAVGSAWVWMNA